MHCRRMVADESLSQRYGGLWALMESTPGQPSLPSPGPAELASVSGLRRELWARHKPLAYLLEVGPAVARCIQRMNFSSLLLAAIISDLRLLAAGQQCVMEQMPAVT